MQKIAILISDDFLPKSENATLKAEMKKQMSLLIPAFAAQNMTLETLRWREASEKGGEYDAVLPLLAWDYYAGNQDEFLAEMARTASRTRLFNDFDILRWNSDKSYLDELESAGAPVIKTYTLDRVTPTGLNKAITHLGTDQVVIKPIIGGGAWRQVLYRAGDPFPDLQTLPPKGALVQAFLPSVRTEGEYSLLYFGGHFSHATRKRPKGGDYRIQANYGGREEPYTPSRSDRKTARAVLDALDYTPLYARVDLIRGLDDQLKLIELEMIEPYLYLPHTDNQDTDNIGARKLAEALWKRLND